MRSIIEQLPDGIVIVGPDGVIKFANPAAEQLFARSAETLAGTDFGFAIADGEPAEIEIVRPDGEPLTAELRVVELLWEDAPARLISIRDITDRRRAEERARQVERERAARAQAEAANQAKSDFLATMSHELRTPLNAVIGYAQLLDLGIGGGLSPEQHGYVERILSSSEHLLGLVTEVLDLAKVDAGRLTVNVGRAPASATAEAAAALVQSTADARGIRFGSALESDAEIWYEGDESRVRQILVNLLTNAVKFTEAGGAVSLTYGRTSRPEAAAVLHAEDEEWTYFTVRDTGIGIPGEQMTRIFEPFVQVATGHTRSNDGSGLGLAISRRLARLMQGDITVRSAVGEGSTFTLWLPSAEPGRREEAADGDGVAAAPTHSLGLAEIGEILLRELQRLLDGFVARLRTECPAPQAAELKFSQLADHVASYLADLAGLLIALEEAAGQPSGVLVDATEIHRVVAVRHGAQRARLGWTVDAIRCEYQLLRDEIERVVREQCTTSAPAAIDGALAVTGRLIREAERLSVSTMTRARAAERRAD